LVKPINFTLIITWKPVHRQSKEKQMPIHTIETFNVQFLSILDENGNVDPDIEPEISREDLLKLHRFMTLSRMTDTRMLNLQRQGRLGTLPVCTGHSDSGY
jgi:pyruvate dehydrogenase E1 component alpha subunit